MLLAAHIYTPPFTPRVLYTLVHIERTIIGRRIVMSASGSVGDEVETSFVSTESSRSRSYHPSSLYVQNESVAHSKSSPSGEEAPLLSSRVSGQPHPLSMQSTMLSHKANDKLFLLLYLICTCRAQVYRVVPK